MDMQHSLSYDIDLSGEPSGISAYMVLPADTTQESQNLGLMVERLCRDCGIQARVRQYYGGNREDFYDLLDWTRLSVSVDNELTISVDKPAVQAGGKTILELKMTSSNSLPFVSGAKVVLTNPWTIQTLLVPQNHVATICDGGDDYRFGFNGQEKVNEVAGLGNHNTALFWEYDTRIGSNGRWNRDPVVNPSVSSYAVFNGNPILYNDLLGNVGEPVVNGNTLTIYSDIVFYGGAATPELANQAAKNIQTQWTNAKGTVNFQGKEYKDVKFVVKAKEIVSETRAQSLAATNKGVNYDPRLNFARIESRNDVPKNTANRVAGEVPSGDNSMFFLAEDISPEGTSQAHEMGHGFGLGMHVSEGERFLGVPRIMTTRNSLVDKDYSVDGTDGGMLNVNCREVTQSDISGIKFNEYKKGIGSGIKVGNSSNILFDSKGKSVGATAPVGIKIVQPK